ncbi:MAG: polysaccharide pyruvyl transferase family protein [Anaerolineae bacterium]|nr:polysaccharide pyruvyl transferase family protein [Anaerolineae bacterium]
MEKQTETIRVVATQREEGQTQAMEKAIARADIKAQKVAASLGVRLLERVSLETKMDLDAAAKRATARAEAVYRTSAFSQARLDLRLLGWETLKQFLRKEFVARWFQFRFKRLPGPETDSAARPVRRALVTGHFSIPGGGGTFGDIEAQEKVCEWLSEAGIPFDVASNFEDGIDGVRLEQVNPADYAIFVFVCGPWYPERSIPALLLQRFGHCLKIGVNLTVAEPGLAGFDFLLARDNPNEIRADIAFGRKAEALPVVGVLLVERQAAYGSRQRHLYVRQIFEEYLKTAQVVPIWLDTIIYGNKVGLQSARQFESLLRKVDVLITNRLHGLVLGLKNAVPVVAVDSIAGGGKVTAQAKALGWPVLIPVEELDVEKLAETVQMCFERGLAPELEQTHQQGLASIDRTRAEFEKILQDLNRPESL